MHAFIEKAKKSFSFQKGSDEVLREWRSFLSKMGINNFYYVRITRKGELVYLTNQVDYALDYWKAGLPLCTGFLNIPKEVQNSFILWENDLDPKILDFVRSKKGYDGFSFIRRSYKLIQFASFIYARPLENPTQCHLKNYTVFSCWLREFEMKQRKLIREAELNPMVLPEEYLAPQKDCFFSKKAIELNYQQIRSKISFRELDCLYFYTRGFTSPRIAEYLNISSRTVETHLNTIKNQFGLSSRDDLALLSYSNPFLNSYTPTF